MILENLVKKYNNTSVVIKIFIWIILGTIVACVFPKASWLCVLGDLFVGALKAIAPMLVFILVISSLANGSKKYDGRFRMVIFLYILSTLVAVFCAVTVSFYNDIAMHVVGVGFIVGVIQDSLETALNSSSDVTFSAVADYHRQK